jgi:very-short-patch-repair endonuclease
MPTHGVKCLFGDDEDAANERLHYGWLKRFYFPSSDFLIYPNLALQILIDANRPEVQNELAARSGPINLPNTPWDPQNFLITSCVDLCVIQKTDYVPLLVVEIDGESHKTPLQRLRDGLKDSLLNLVGLPLIRLPVETDQTEQDKQTQLSTALAPFKQRPSRKSTRDVFLNSEIARHYRLLSQLFSDDDVLMLPNVALTSIFRDDHVRRLSLHAERNLCRTGLVDFLFVGTEDLRPIVALSLGRDELKQQMFAAFRLPLLHLRPVRNEPATTNRSL